MTRTYVDAGVLIGETMPNGNWTHCRLGADHKDNEVAIMAQPLPEPRGDTHKRDDLLDGIDGAELFAPVDINGDLRAAVRRAAKREERLVVCDGGEELLAILPLADIRFLLRLENAELDRFDLEEIRKAEANPDDQERIPLDVIRAELAL